MRTLAYSETWYNWPHKRNNHFWPLWVYPILLGQGFFWIIPWTIVGYIGLVILTLAKWGLEGRDGARRVWRENC